MILRNTAISQSPVSLEGWEEEVSLLQGEEQGGVQGEEEEEEQEEEQGEEQGEEQEESAPRNLEAPQ